MFQIYLNIEQIHYSVGMQGESMKWFVGIVFLALVGYVSLSPVGNIDSSEFGVTPGKKETNCTCGWVNKDPKRIVGGSEAEQHEFPMIAGIVYKDSTVLFCGSTIVTKRHVVTAGHCAIPFVDKPHQIGIHAGHHNYHKIKKETKLRDVEKIIIHPNYNKKNLKYDIAMLVLSEALPDDPKIGPACLPTYRLPMVGQKVRVLGWGLTTNKGKPSKVLRKVDVDIKPFEDCMFTNLYMEIFDKHQLCSFTRDKDSCTGDSGGPLLWRDPETNRFVLAAATSYGSFCGRNPAVNTEISYFVPWIQRMIAETDPTMKTCGNA